MTARPVVPAQSSALRLDVHGVVQGVGFRPFVHRLAARLGLTGWVRNEGGGVQIVIEGDHACLLAFLQALTAEAPPLARIDALEVAEAERGNYDSFSIAVSADQADRRQPIAPDVALCAACEAELFDPANRRYRYPFITCTDCGPRFTVIEAMPYDRERTSMRSFRQCPDCLREYESPWDRRYHSETNSCPACGPRVRLLPAGEPHQPAVDGDAIGSAARLLTLGLIVAVRGLGGFHLAVDATNQDAVERLRRRKRRDAKPLAVMVRTVEDARRLAQVGPEEQLLLESRERPVVLLTRHGRTGLATSVAPGLDTIGVMTAYTPLHHLLLDAVRRPLVMTSGNASEEPIATAIDDARRRLADIADAFLVHDREIVARYDDSVVRVVNEAPVFLRRARGYAPLPLQLPIASPTSLVAVGPHLKNTFTLVQGAGAYVSQHIGDLENLETLEHFLTALATYRRLFRIDPAVAVRDRHPEYMSSGLADELGLERVITVQHHHAHVAAVAAEHGVTQPIIGLAFDGSGYGDDECVWGGEILVGDLTEYRRIGHLRYAPLPGGDVAARQPWRAALGYAALAPDGLEPFQRALAGATPAELDLAGRQISAQLNAPLASSMGRLFDAAAAVLGVRHVAQFEGQAAMELEALAGRRLVAALPFPLLDGGDGFLLDPIPLLIAIGERAQAGDDVADLAARFHESVVAASVAAAERVRAETDIELVALGGGVFQNARLLHGIAGRLEAVGFQVLTPRHLGPNDGAISYGQAAVAAALLAREG